MNFFLGLSQSETEGCSPHWQHQEIRNDSSESSLKLRPGEVLVAMYDNIEDSKDVMKEIGTLSITTLRLIWRSQRNRKSNLSIGYNCLLSVITSVSESRIKGDRVSLSLTAKFERSRFEFSFSGSKESRSTLAQEAANHDIFASVFEKTYQSFSSSKIYRDLRVKGAIVTNNELDLLEYEIVYAQINGVLNVSNDKGTIGRMVFTNIRTVWFSTMEDFSNVSIPHLQVLHARVQNSKYGPALCIETYKTPLVLSYKLGFQVPSEPPNKLKQMANFIRDLVVSYFENPIFGVQFEESVNVSEQRTCDARDSQATLATDDEEENDGITDEEIPSLLKYIAEEEKEELEFVFDERLGLTVTRPKGSSLTSGDLWKLVG